MKKFMLWALILVFCSGCGVGWKESLRGLAGTSTKILEDNLAGAESQEFNLGYDAAYTKAMALLKKMEAYVYRVEPKKKLVAIYISEEDTTPVGIFFKATDKNKTLISVSSPSSFAKRVISVKLFAGMEK